VLNRLHQSRRFDELAQHILQNVFGVIDVAHPYADEAPQTVLLLPDGVGDSSVLSCHVEKRHRLVHLPTVDG